MKNPHVIGSSGTGMFELSDGSYVPAANAWSAERVAAQRTDQRLTDAGDVFNIFEDINETVRHEAVANAMHELEGDVYEEMSQGDLWTEREIRDAAEALLANE